MPLIDDLNGLVIELSERNEFFEAHTILKTLSATLLSKLQQFEYIKNKGSFNTIPGPLKAVMLRWEAAYQVCKASLMDDEEIVEVYQWEK